MFDLILNRQQFPVLCTMNLPDAESIFAIIIFGEINKQLVLCTRSSYLHNKFRTFAGTFVEEYRNKHSKANTVL